MRRVEHSQVADADIPEEAHMSSASSQRTDTQLATSDLHRALPLRPHDLLPRRKTKARIPHE